MSNVAPPASITPVPRLEFAAVFALGAILSAVPAWDDGGYFAGTWSWIALVTFFVVTLRLILVSTVPLQRLDLALLVGLVALTAWIALSGVWAPALTPVVNEATRMFAYVGVVLVTLLTTRKNTVEALLAGVLAGVVVVSGYALATRVFPNDLGHWDPATVYRLSDPIGYWNGLGIYAAMGAVLALGLVARASGRVLPVLAGLAPPLLIPTMLFTFSRGAWLGLAAGFVAAFIIDRHRLQLLTGALVLAPCSALLVLVATQNDVLTTSTATVAEFADQGRGFGTLIVAMSIASAFIAFAFRLACDRVVVPIRVRQGFVVGLAALALCGFGVVWASQGAPWSAAGDAWDRFTAPPKDVGVDVSGRLFDLSSSGRVDLWHTSWHSFEDDPIVGAGAGTFPALWAVEPQRTLFSLEGHSLYFETLGELGAAGLALLVGILALPLLAAVQRRREPMAVVAVAPYVAFVAHAGVDWDWELAGVTIVALLAGASLIVTARRESGERDLPGVFRVAVPVLTGALAVGSVFLMVGGISLDRARVANQQGTWAVAEAHASRAVRWAPWSSVALQERGRAEVGLGRRSEAREDFLTAIKRTPNDYSLWADLAGVSDGRAAIDAINRAIALNPTDDELRDRLERYQRSS